MKPPRFITLLALGLPLALSAQNTILNESFTGDSLNPATYPAVTAGTTGWEVLSNKAAPAPTETGGVFTINMAGTTSGFIETQALFAAAPVQLLPGTYLELAATFTPANVLTTASDNLIFGFFNSGGVSPLGGLLNSGLSNTLTTFATGGAKGWIGYNAKLPISGSPAMLTRPAQVGTNNTVQDVLVAGQSSSVGYSTPASASASNITALAATLTNGSTYTLDYKLSLSADGLTLTAAVALYNGAGTTGTGANTLIGSCTGKYSGATLITKSFDALALGWRADAGTASPSNLKLTALSVKTTGGTPWFTTQPPASVLVSLGSDLNLTAAVAGIVTGEQWQVSTDGGATYVNLDSTANPSAATTTLTITNVQNATAGRYRLVATNAAGSTASTPCLVSVSATPVAPSIVTNPAGATALGGTPQSFSVTVNGTSPLSYQWQQSTDGGVTFAPVAGATGATYTIPAVSLSDEGFYDVVVSNVAGSATSTAAQLVVNQPLAITAQPVGAALNLGASYTLSVTAVGKPAPTYQWSLNGSAISGATGATYTIAAATAANAGLYTVVASNSVGDSVTSAGAAVAVLSPTLVTTALTPVAIPTGVAPDTRLTLTFNQPVSIGVTGTIKIFDAANATTPVDTIDLVTATALMKSLRVTSTLSTLALPVQNKTVGTLTNFNYYPITISGNTATIYPRNNVLTYGRTYFVTVDPGVFTDSTGLSATGISGAAGWTFSTASASPSTSATQFVVAADGSGDFCTVQAAIDFIPSGNTTPRTIFIRKGTYFEQVYFTGKHALTFLGEDRAQTVIAYPNNNTFNNVTGSYHRMTLQADHVNNAVFANLTVQNTTPKGGSQAEALILNGTTTAQAIVSNVTLLSFQDTLQVNGQAYVTDSHISGDVDFMWGTGPCFFNNCELTQLTSAAYFTQVRNGSGNHGFVYSNCRFDAPAGVTGDFFGRIDPAAFPTSEVVVVDSQVGDATNNAFLSTTTGVSGANYLAGWWLLNNAANAAAAPGVHNWTNNLVNAGNATLTNPNSDAFTTMPGDTATQANYRNAVWVLGNIWTPAFAPVITTPPMAQVVSPGSSFTLSVQAFGLPALTYQWSRNGVPIAGATSANYTVASSGSADAGTYSVVVSNGSGSVTTTAVSLLVHGAPPVIALQPANTSGLLGATATLNAWAQGDGPLTYQWLKNGAPVSGATNQSLRLTGLQASDAGSYAVAVTNAGGTTTTAGATLTIVTPATTVPTLPQIPAAVFDVTAYGAVGDGATDNTAAIQAAINAAKAAGGGTIELPPAGGAYLSGPITLGSHLDLQIDAGATLRALPFGVYPNSNTAPSHFITTPSGSTDVEFSGGGTIDGDGTAWWAAFNAGTIANRPRLIQFTRATNVLITAVTLQSPAMFHIAFSSPNSNVTVFGVTIDTNPNSPNTDGIDPAGTNFLIQNCSIACGDDNIAVKPGSVFCSGITIANCAFGAGHGLSVGGQTNVGLDGMTVTNCTFNGTQTGLRLKADSTQGGPVQHLAFSNITMTNVPSPIVFYSYYNQIGSPGAVSGSSQTTIAKVNLWNATPPNPLTTTTIPTWQHITISNVTATGASAYSIIWGIPLASALINDVTLNNVNISGGPGLEIYDATNVQFTGSTSVGALTTDNALAITGQPGGRTINVGDTVTFSATAVGGSGTNNTGLTYQWNLNGTPLTDGLQADSSTIGGSTTPTLTILNARVTGAGNYTMTASTTLDGFNTTTSALVANSLSVSATSSVAILTVNPLPAAVSLSGLTLTYDGTPKSPLVTTTPTGVAVTLTYDGSPAAPVNAGSYVVVATLADPNYFAAPASGILTIQPAVANVTLTNLAVVYDGTPKGATATSTPAGLKVDLTYDGNVTAPTNAGSYAVVATIDDPNYVGSTGGTLTIAKAVAGVTLGNLNPTYDGAPKPASVHTNPGGLAVVFSYAGGPAAPINAGSYAVVAVVNDANYTGAASGTLVIAKAVATVTLGNLAQVYDGAAKSVTVTTAPAGLNVVTTYDGTASAPSAVGSYAVVSTVQEANYVGTASGTLLITKAVATVTLSRLVQAYDGTPKPVSVVTTPANLAVSVTYNGSATAPTYPASYAVVATINETSYQGTASGTLVITTTAIVRHAPTLSGGLDGSLQVMAPEGTTLNGSALLGGDLLVPGTPSVQVNGHPVYAGTIDANGASAPTNYQVTLGGNAALRHVVRRVDPVALPVVPPPPAPTGTRNVTLNNSSQSPGDFATIRNLTLTGNAGQVVVPAGTYGSFTIDAGNGLTLGVAGATTPTVYNFQNLTINANSSVQLAGPVIINLANGTVLNASVGSVDQPDWLVINLASGGLTLNGNVRCDGYVVAPNGEITLNGASTLNGGVICDKLTINGNGLLKVEDPE